MVEPTRLTYVAVSLPLPERPGPAEHDEPNMQGSQTGLILRPPNAFRAPSCSRDAEHIPAWGGLTTSDEGRDGDEHGTQLANVLAARVRFRLEWRSDVVQPSTPSSP